MDYFGLTGGKPTEIRSQGKRSLFLLSIGGLCEIDSPSEIEEYEKLSADIDAYRIDAAIAWGQLDNASPKDIAAWLIQNRSGSEWAIHLNDDGRSRVKDLQSRADALDSSYQRSLVTLMVRNRILYHVIAESAAGNNLKLAESPWFTQSRGVRIGDRFMAGDRRTVVEIAGAYDSASQSVPITDSIRIPPNTPLFLVGDNGDYEYGFDGWTDDDTKKYLTNLSAKGLSQRQQIKAFYESEKTEKGVDTDDDRPLEIELTSLLDLQNLLSDRKDLESTPSQNALIGTQSLFGSTIGDVKTNDSELG